MSNLFLVIDTAYSLLTYKFSIYGFSFSFWQVAIFIMFVTLCFTFIVRLIRG